MLNSIRRSLTAANQRPTLVAAASFFGYAAMKSSPSNKPFAIQKVNSSAPTWTYLPQDFKRMDESSDLDFYNTARFVNHIDENAIAQLTRYYSEVIPRKATILDICSSWVSHLPSDIEPVMLIGYGMNEKELRANKFLTEKMVQDLNIDPRLGIEDNSVDAVICNVSIDYLTRPREVLAEVARVLKPDSCVHLAISNRCFPTKVIGRWLKISEDDRLSMVADYFHFASHDSNDTSPSNLYKDVEIIVVEEGGWKDPLWVVRAKKA